MAPSPAAGHARRGSAVRPTPRAAATWGAPKALGSAEGSAAPSVLLAALLPQAAAARPFKIAGACDAGAASTSLFFQYRIYMCTRLAIVYTFGWLLLAGGWLRWPRTQRGAPKLT